MSLRETVNGRTGASRFYVNGRRVSRAAFNAARFWRTVDTFQTVTRGELTRHYSEARN